MTYTEAVSLALAGDNRGFSFLYNQTRTKKLYLAQKYVGDRETAEDVLQEAYLAAWNHLSTLEDPENFEKWLGAIVCNRAKNVLVKRQHTALDQQAQFDEEEETNEVFDRAVSPWENLPELSYTQKETAELVHELLDQLPEEQRMALLMFEIEGASIREIAQSMDCSEATVKSRLKYGREKIKTKAEELQKKGYKLFGLAPLAFLVCLLRKDEIVFASEFVTGPSIATGTSGGANTAGKANAELLANAGKQTASKAGGVAKKAFIATKAGKITAAAVASVAVVTAAGVATYQIVQSQNESSAPIEYQLNNQAQALPDTDTQAELTETERMDEDAAEQAQEAYEGFLRGEIPAYFDTVSENTETYNHFDSIMANYLIPGTAYTLDEFRQNAHLGWNEDYFEETTAGQFQYAYIDCGNDGIPELAVTMDFDTETFGTMYDFYVFKLIDDSLECIYEAQYGYRESLTVNMYGLCTSGGSTGYASAYSQLVYIDETGTARFVQSLETEYDATSLYSPFGDDITSAAIINGIDYNLEIDEYSIMYYADDMDSETYYSNLICTYVPLDENGDAVGEAEQTAAYEADSRYRIFWESTGLSLYTQEEAEQILAEHRAELGVTDEILNAGEPSWKTL